MSTFDLYLLKDPPTAPDLEAVVDGLIGRGAIEPVPDEHDRVWYRNPHTGVSFPLTLSFEVATTLASRLHPRGHMTEESGVESEDFAGAGDAGRPPLSFEGTEDEADDGGDEAEEGDGDLPEPEAPVVAMTIPTLCPSFVACEAIDFAVALSRAAHLRLEHPEAAEGETPEGSSDPAAPGGPASPEAIFTGWDRTRREFARRIIEAGGKIEIPLWKGARITVSLTSWSAAKAEGWWKYGLARGELAAALEAEGIRVPFLQAAFHGGSVKTLCDWEAWRPAVLPRTDLVLVRRRRLRKGFLKTKEVLEEGIADGARVWDLLAPLCERRSEPAELLVFPQAEPFPALFAAMLDALPLEPLDSARRVPLVGVVDLDVAALREGWS